MKSSIPVLMLILAFIIFLSGCTSSPSSNVKKFSYTCPDCNCPVQKEFCKGKGMESSLTDSGGMNEILLYPTKQITCTYYCVTAEELEKQKKDPNYQYFICSQMDESNGSNNDFYFPTKFGLYTNKIDFQMSYLKSLGIEILSIEGAGDFEGKMTLIDEWDDRIGGHQMKWSSVRNLNPGSKNVDGQIIFKYKKNGVVKSFTSVCKSNT